MNPSTEFVWAKQKVVIRDKQEYVQLSMHHKVYFSIPNVSIDYR
jgi:hypothetical protein